MSDRGDPKFAVAIFTSHCPNPMSAFYPEVSGRVGNTALGEEGDVKLHPFMSLHTKGDSSMVLYLQVTTRAGSD